MFMDENEISNKVIGCALKVHRSLGPGLLESAYETCLYYECMQHQLFAERQKPIPLVYQEVKMECGYRADLVIERKVIIEIKSVEALNEIHVAQAITHLRLTGFKLGLLINFNVVFLKDGIKRIANKL
jgi:GxxExxY protein